MPDESQHYPDRVQYLSPQWVAAADKALQAAADSAPSDGLTIDQLVSGGADYRVTIARGASGVELIDGADESPAHARFSQDLATAQAVAQGTTDAHQAFLLGHISFTGDINVLIERRDALTWLEAALAPVLEATTF